MLRRSETSKYDETSFNFFKILREKPKKTTKFVFHLDLYLQILNKLTWLTVSVSSWDKNNVKQIRLSVSIGCVRCQISCQKRHNSDTDIRRMNRNV